MTDHENLQIARHAFHEAQKNVVKAQELVDRYEIKIHEIEEKPNFVGNDTLYYLERLKNANILLKERENNLIVREKSLKEREQHLILVNNPSSTSTDVHDDVTNTVASREFEDARRYLLNKIDYISLSIEKQGDLFIDQLNSMKTEIQGFNFVPNGVNNSSNAEPELFINPLLEGVDTTTLGYQVHIYDGAMHRVPVDWRIPRCNVRDLWKQWWIGDINRHIPPLRYLTSSDVKHIDDIPLSELEMIGRKGQYKYLRRKSFKNLGDMRFLMTYITRMVYEVNAMEDIITPESVDRMFESISHKLSDKDGQNKWQSFLRKLRSPGNKHQQQRPDSEVDDDRIDE